MEKKTTSENVSVMDGETTTKTYDELMAEVAELRAVLASISDGVYIGGINGITMANQTALDQLGFATCDDLNRGVEILAAEINTRDAKTGTVLSLDEQPFALALKGERVIRDVRVRHRLSGEEMVVRCAASPVLQDGRIVAAVAVNTDITEQYRNDALIRDRKARKAFLLKLSDALRTLSDPIAIQDTATRYLGEQLNVDRTFYAWMLEDRQVSIVERDYVRNQSISLIGEHRFADFDAAIRTMRSGQPFFVRDVLYADELKPQLENYQAAEFVAVIAVPLIKDEKLVACLAVTCLSARDWTDGELSLIEEVAERTWSAVERARSDAALQESRELLNTVFESLPVGVCFIKSDGTIALSNKEITHYLPDGIMPSKDLKIFSRWQGWDENDNLIKREDAPGARALRGEAVWPGIEMLYQQNDGQQVWTQVSAVPVRNSNGQIIGEITIINDIDKIKCTAEALKKSELQFRTFVAASADLVYRLTADWSTMFVRSRRALPATPEIMKDDWFDLFIPGEEQVKVREAMNLATKGKKMLELEHKALQKDRTIGWRLSRVVPVMDNTGEIQEWLGTTSDITARKRAQGQLQELTSRLEHEIHERTLELKESRDELQSIFDTTLMQMSILQAVRDGKNEIVDFKIRFTNKELERETGRHDLVGRLYAEEYPGIRDTGIFDRIVKTINSGEPQQYEYYYPYENFNKWYSCMFVKLKDGVLAVNMDITDRKEAEEDRYKNYMLLHQSEEMASLGSWDFDVLTGVFSWSDGMYRLFNMEKETEVAPEIYLSYSTISGRPAAERVVNHIRKGDTDFAETLEIEVDGQIKILQVKATVIKTKNGTAVRVLGVDMDTTASRMAAEKIKKMEAQQQQEIFRVTLASQEEERRRISESLHNGLAQTLYGVKINLSTLTVHEAVTKPDNYARIKKFTEDLLKNAIAESRLISHQLMPSMLEDFGLEAAISDVCSRMAGDIKFHCTFRGLEPRFDKYMELAIFRTVQELILNIVKHSGASTATIKVSLQNAKVLIEARDNGRGFDSSKGNGLGIGLASIRSKVKLLDGKILTDSIPGNGTVISVYFPINN